MTVACHFQCNSSGVCHRRSLCTTPNIFFRRYIFLSIVRKTVRELLFEGYKDDVLEVGMDMSDYDEEGEVNMEKFGWFYDVSTILIWRISVK